MSETPRDWEKEIVALLDWCGERAIHVRPNGSEDVLMSLWATVGGLRGASISSYRKFRAALERGEYDHTGLPPRTRK